MRSPQADQLTALLNARGATVERQNDGALSVRGLDAAAIGDLAAEQRLALHELTPEQASLEETYFELTNDTVDFRAEPAVPTGGA